MSKKTKKPELRVRRAFTNERPLLELFADVYRIYFTEKKRTKSSGRTFDLGKAADYNDDTEENKEESNDGYTGLNYDRPDFQRMIDDIALGKIGTISRRDSTPKSISRRIRSAILRSTTGLTVRTSKAPFMPR